MLIPHGRSVIGELSPYFELFRIPGRRVHSKDPSDERIHTFYTPRGPPSWEQRQFGWPYIHPEVPFPTRLWDELLRIGYDRYMYHESLLDVPLDSPTKSFWWSRRPWIHWDPSALPMALPRMHYRRGGRLIASLVDPTDNWVPGTSTYNNWGR
jgi:hypothetical protein